MKSILKLAVITFATTTIFSSEATVSVASTLAHSHPTSFIPDLPKIPPKKKKGFIPDLPPIKPKKR